jgi:hypothetical protein
MWTICAEPVESPQAIALLREYFAELTVRYFHRETTEEEIDATLEEFRTTGLALFLVLRASGEPAGCLGLYPSGELTRIYIFEACGFTEIPSPTTTPGRFQDHWFEKRIA